MNSISKPIQKSILTVDINGAFGKKLTEKLAEDDLVVYVSKKRSGSYNTDNIFFSEYKKNAPVIPNQKYSHIFVVYNVIWKKDFVSSFVKKAVKDNSHLFFLVSLSDSKLFFKIYNKISPRNSARVIIFGDIFDKENHPDFIKTAIEQELIRVKGNGLSKAYSIFLDDAVLKLIDLAFSQNSTNSLFYLFPKTTLTEISYARMIQKASPGVAIDFTLSSPKEQINFPLGGTHLLSEDYPLERRIGELGIEELALENKEKKRGTKFFSKKKRRLPFSWFFRFLFLLALMPLIATAFFSFFGFLSLGGAKTAIEQGSLSGAKNSVYISKTFFALAGKSSEVLLMEAKFVGAENILSGVLKKVSLGEDLSLAFHSVLEASEIFSEFFIGRGNSKADFEKGVELLKKAIIIYRKNEAEGQIPQDFLAKAKSLDELIKIAEDTTDILPGLFGFDGKKTYLVLFQNSAELRPGGGFIGSYALLALEGGRIADFSIHDVYDADGQLKEHVEPPYALRRHLELPHWYLRDSNFDVDFEKAASSAALLLDKELGTEVDGVIGIDLYFVKNILEAMGEVYVSDYKQIVTADNFYQITQSHAEKNFFPGSRQKKNFLTSLFNSMQSSITLRDNIAYLQLAEKISDSIYQKHILFAFDDKDVQDIFRASGWSSSLSKAAKSTNVLGSMSEDVEIVSDFLGINEANLGVNKANFFVERKLSQEVNVDEEGRVVGKVGIKYHNSSNSWPGGDYVNYLRVILPLNASLLSVSFDGVYQDIIPAVTDFTIYEEEDFVPPIGLEVERYDQDGKTIYGFLISVEAGKNKSIEIEYELSQKISFDKDDFSYSLEVFKQPGTDNYPYSFSLIYPENLKLIDGVNSFSGTLEGDKEIKASLSQK